MLNNAALKDVADNDPAGIKEIRLQLKDNAYLLGLDLSKYHGSGQGRFLRCPSPTISTRTGRDQGLGQI